MIAPPHIQGVTVSTNALRAVPVVNIAHPTRTSMAAVDAACRDHGFFLLTGHGLDELIASTWDQTRRLFNAERSIRIGIERTLENPLGYYDRELTKRRRDNKEVFDFVDPMLAKLDAKNRWPTALPGFRDSMVEFFDAFSLLAERALSLVHEALELSPHARAHSIGSRHSSTTRLNHYPLHDPVPISERDQLPQLGATALGYHTDPGVITLLLQDDTGGLQTQSRDATWIDVPPTPDTVVVNLGDCMQAWTNDRYRAAVHRVLPMTHQNRFSIPYFYNPPRDAVIEPIAELCADGPRYRAIAWREFIQARVTDNYTDLGSDDTQVTDYRVAG